MNITNLYIIQAIIVASNNLRLSSEKIEIISILKNYLSQADNLEEVISEMKKVTELSKLAIKLGKLHDYINSDSIDFLKITDSFKEQSHSLVIEFSNLLNSVTSISFRELLSRITPIKNNVDIAIKTPDSEVLNNYNFEKSQAKTINDDDISNRIELNEKLKKDLILNEIPDDNGNEFDYDVFEKTIVNQIKSIEVLLKNIIENKFDPSDLNDEIEKLKINAKLSKSSGFNLIAEMHAIVIGSFKLINNGILETSSDIIENIRACLIVIVAAVREKDVDISNYLKRAQHFGIELQKIVNQRENK